jgi:ABC-2 type transport system permease protein
LRDWEVLLGKYLAVFVLYAVLVLLTLLYPLILAYFARVEWGAILSGYLGLLLMGSSFLAIGLFASSLTSSQIVAAAWTFGILLLLWVVGWGADSLGGTWGKVLQHGSTLEHNDNFAKGVLDTKDVLYYVNLTILALFLAFRSLEVRRWKG